MTGIELRRERLDAGVREPYPLEVPRGRAISGKSSARAGSAHTNARASSTSASRPPPARTAAATASYMSGRVSRATAMRTGPGTVATLPQPAAGGEGVSGSLPSLE
jgi:hypothetical protein